MCSNALSNRKIILNSQANDEHQNYSLGVNSNLFRFQLPSTTPRYGWFAATGSGTSNELMSLTGTGQLTVGQSATSLITISKLGLLTGFGGYLKLGGNETGLLSNRLIGFGYNFSNNNQPAYIGYQERDSNAQTNGDLIFGTRGVTSNAVPTERMRILANGDVLIGQQGTVNLTVSKASLGNAAPVTVPTGTYLKIGGSEFRSGVSNSLRLIGFGYNTGTNNQPAYMGYVETNGSSQSNGALIFGTRPDNTANDIPTERMRISALGNVSIGNTNDIFPLEVTGTIRSTSSRPDTILDTSNAAGTAGQLLSSTGTALSWINPPAATVPGGLTSNVQFNLAGAFGGTPNFTFTDTTSHLKTAGLLTVGSTFTTVPRIFAQSGTALFAVSSWDDQWILAGGGSGAANSAGIGMGYNNSITSGIIACSEPSSGYKPIIYSAASHDFKTNGSTRMTVTQTGGGDGLLTVPILEATQIRDGLSNTGTNGQFLSSDGIGLLWTTPLPYADSLSAVGAFITTAPVPATTPTMVFNVPRAGRYRITTNVVTFPTAGNVTVTVETYWRESVVALPYNLALTSTSFQNNINIHQAFPGKSGYVTLPAGSIDIVIRTGANTGSNASDPVNVDLLECTI
jgi:hypothetical protein